MNYKMLFLKIAKLSEFVIPLSRLFHLITVNRKNEFLKKSMFDIEPRNLVDIISCSVCIPSGGD